MELIIYFVLIAGINIANSKPYQVKTSSVHNVIKLSNNLKQTDLCAESNPKICLQEECVHIASKFLSNMDVGVDPCEDFFKFACGSYPNNHPIPEEKGEISPVTELTDLVSHQLQEILEEPIHKGEPSAFKKLKKYYNSCKNTQRIEKMGLNEVKTIFRDLGGWPIVEDIEPKTNWEEIVYGFSKIGLSGNYLFELYVDVDYVNSSKRMLFFASPELELTNEYLSKGKKNHACKSYYDFMVAAAVYFGSDEATAKKDMNDVLDFEMEISKAQKSLVEIQENFTLLHNVYTIEKLENDFPNFPWLRYINKILPDDINFTRSMEVVLTEPKYAKSLERLLQETPPRTVRNYLLWRAVCDLSPYLNKELETIVQEFKSAILGESKAVTRSKECIERINDKFIRATSALYVRRFFDTHSKTVATELITYIKETFTHILNETNWTDRDKHNAKEKIDVLYPHVAFPNELLDDNIINLLYKEVEINHDYLKNSLNLEKFEATLRFRQLLQPVNKTDWIDIANSVVVNAYYKPESNAIILPAAILQGAYFNANRPKYVNFAAIGSVIGHEVSHGFDEVGCQFDKDGGLANWWSKEAEKDLLDKKHCLIEQYNRYTSLGLKIKGNMTVGENLADFSGQKVAYLSYRNWAEQHEEEPGLPGLNYTNNQMFWIAGASIWCNTEKPESTKFRIATDTHPPNEFRVNGPLSNMEMFSKDFTCPLGSKMNPIKKCKPW